MRHYITLIFLSLVTMTQWNTAAGATLSGSTATDSLTLSLAATIKMAQELSPAAQSARNSFLAAYWQYRYFRANYLPSVTLTSTPYINKETNKITQSDGSVRFMRQDQFGADLSLKINQNIPFTGGSLFVKSNLTRLDELLENTTAYNSQPLIVGYEQSLFGFNSLKWDRRIEPVRYREARKQYAETMELIAADACSRFFALASALDETEMARQNYAAADTLFKMARGRYDIGTITENEMLQLEINCLNAETSRMDAEIELEDQTQRFLSYLGLPQTTAVSLVLPDSVPPFQVAASKALELAIEHSPDPEYYRRIQLQSRSSLAQAKANRGLKADIYVQFGLSQTGADISTAYRDLNNQVYASVSLSLPILDWGRGRGKVRMAKSQLDLTNTQAEQGMSDFGRNVEKLVMQFNMQHRKVAVATLTDRRADHRHTVARKLYMMGRNSLLDLNSAISEKNSARRNRLATIKTYWQLYYTLRSMTAFDFETNRPIADLLDDELKNKN